jgi:hypothetical protein
MSRSVRYPLILGSIVMASVRLFLAGTAEPNLTIAVRVYNLAHVSAPTLAQAEKVATRIFREVGIDTVWLECPPSASDVQRFAGCQPNLGPMYLNLRLIPRFDSVGAGFRRTDLGFASPSKEEGVYASIFYHRVQQIARTGPASEPQILGHAIAHEIGHLLLGSNSHSSTGIMRAQWRRDDLRRATVQLLRFTQEERERMRADVSARLKQQETRQALGPGSPK